MVVDFVDTATDSVRTKGRVAFHILGVFYIVFNDALQPFSLVCKVVSADGRPTVKLSDNPNKAMGPKEEIERYKKIFGVDQQVTQPVIV